MKETKLIQRLTDIARRLIQNGEVDEAISQLDAGLLVFSSSAFLVAMRTRAGLIGDRPSGSEIIEQYKTQHSTELNGSTSSSINLIVCVRRLACGKRFSSKLKTRSPVRDLP
jgi:hypothetical protein